MCRVSRCHGARRGRGDAIDKSLKNLLVLLGVLAFCGLRAEAQIVDRITFRTPEEAASALAGACREHNESQLLSILGPLGGEIISSGDVIADKAALQKFADAFEQAHELVPAPDGALVLQVGPESWPLPIPIVKHGDTWYFATFAGKAELISRRIKSNELSAINVCRLYVELQTEYGQRNRDPNNQAPLYAQKLRSDPGAHNGLYWNDKAGGARSPAGALFALAAQEGYRPDGSQQVPYHGYYFRILTAQGESAPGGKQSYFCENDIGVLAVRKMTKGFALVAYPAKYGSTGTKTFIVNQDGIVYEQDFGSRTEDVARRMIEYNPDQSWSQVY